MKFKIKDTTNNDVVITSQDIQNAYMKFYTYMMDYLWGMPTVKHLANLEIAIFRRFPDKEEMEKCLDLLEVDIRDTYRDTDDPNCIEFKDSLELLRDYISHFDESGYDIYCVEQAVDIEEIKEDSEDHKTLHVGRVVTR